MSFSLQMSQWIQSLTATNWRILRAAQLTKSRYQVLPLQEQDREAHLASLEHITKVGSLISQPSELLKIEFLILTIS